MTPSRQKRGRGECERVQAPIHARLRQQDFLFPGPLLLGIEICTPTPPFGLAP
jgi:hypothetical protein